jgi:hypothetical protein
MAPPQNASAQLVAGLGEAQDTSGYVPGLQFGDFLSLATVIWSKRRKALRADSLATSPA